MRLEGLSQGWPERIGHPAQALQHVRAIRPEAQHLAQPLVERCEGPVSSAGVLDHEDVHRGREDASHRPHRTVMMTGRERDDAAAGQRARLFGRGGPAFVQDRADDRAADRPAHPRPLDGWSGMEDGARTEARHDVDSRPDVHEEGAGVEHHLDRPLVGRGHPRADRVVPIVLQSSQEQAKAAIAISRRPPVEFDDGGAVRAGPSSELGDADVQGMDALGKHRTRHGFAHGALCRGGASLPRSAASQAAWALLGATITPALASVSSCRTRS